MNLGYLTAIHEEGKYIGGLLVVDELGIPLEFKYTEPFEPTRLQRVLYGKSLEMYVEHGLIMKSLLKNAETRPDVYFTDRLEAIDYLDDLVFIGGAILTTEDKPEEGEVLLDIGRGRGLRLVGKREIPQNLLDELQEVSQSLDLLEPFSRLRQALKLIISGEEA